ncbi:MAG: hypothetical protein HGA67_03935 [Candidatus Yonathbacteria bacterium]|nr:hypothetical protein [Candidatus Yonathbacteria bacterium]
MLLSNSGTILAVPRSEPTARLASRIERQSISQSFTIVMRATSGGTYQNANT